MTLQTGRIIRSHGRLFIVETPDESIYECTTRGKRVDFACGDEVDIQLQNAKQGVIEQAHPRRSTLYRQDQWKTKVIAANVTRILFVTAAKPAPNEELLGRCLIAAEANQIEPVIIVNKTDLASTAQLLKKLVLYQNLGYPLIAVSATHNAEALNIWLENHTCVLVGQSGIGKSTLINALLPAASARTGEISSTLNAGRHTTTHATLYHINKNSHLIDSPGLQSFGLNHLTITELVHSLPEMRPYIGHCRFHNCTHRVEPGCAILAAHVEKKIESRRLSLLQKITNELININPYA